MKKLLKRFGVALVLIVAALLVALAWYRSASQPTVDGKLQVSGLSASVDIVRDTEGIPHIYAQSIDDAYFSLGFVHAQDRLWQLELNRRIAAGRMAEILGAGAVDVDRFLRTLGVRRNAEKILPNFSAETRAALDAYARGINAYLIQRKGPLPPEFLLTGAPAPAPWQAADSIGWQTMMAWDLGANWSQEILRLRMSQRFSLEQINQLLPPYPGDAVLKTQDYTKLYAELAGMTKQLVSVAKIAPASYADGLGSNNWVVSGKLSETGKPLLANDPHLSLSAPALWYFAHLSAPGLNAIGATLPGLPGVVLGRNDRIAWGFTNTAPDVQDLYIERINPNDAKQYQTPDGWSPFNTRIETIKVKNERDVMLEVRESRHGPILTGVLPSLQKSAAGGKQYAVAFSWTALRPDDLTLQAGLKFGQAKNWQEFVAAARDFSSPQQNMVYADVDGNIGFIAPGRVPVRKPENDLQGLAPAPGWDARYDWNGFIPFDQLPMQYNPATQRIVTANQKIVGADYPHFLTSEWLLPYRANRIAALLDAKPRHSMTSFAEMQDDHTSLAARELLPILRATIPRTTRAKAALQKLSSWNGEMAIDRNEPLIFNAWVREISHKMFADALGDIFEDYWEHKNFYQAMVKVLQDKDGQGKWCLGDKKSAAQPQSCAELLALTLDLALNDLSERYGSEIEKWQWAEAHMARSEHRPFGKVALLAKWFDIRVPMPGDAFTVNVGQNNLRDKNAPFVAKKAASLRALYDLSDLESSRFIHSTGQSGNMLSPLYGNYTQRWAKTAYLPMQTNRKSVEKNSLGTLVLKP